MANKRIVLAYTECRTFGHSWDRYNASGARTYDFTLRCVRCTTTRHDNLDVRGELEKRKYGYPDDYKEMGVKLTRAELRVALRKLL